jgi:hypothetical protein
MRLLFPQSPASGEGQDSHIVAPRGGYIVRARLHFMPSRSHEAAGRIARRVYDAVRRVIDFEDRDRTKERKVAELAANLPG